MKKATEPIKHNNSYDSNASYKNETRILDRDGNILKAGAIVINGGKVLLLYRNKWEDWSFPKGHLEENESIEQCLMREISEETGLEIEILKPISDVIYEYPEGDGTVCVKMFLVKPISGDLRPEYPKDQLGWYSIDDAMELLTDDNYKDLLKSVGQNIEG